MATGCFYCEAHHEGRENLMLEVGKMKAGTLYLFKDQAHKGRCALALGTHKKELCECGEQERNDFCADLAAASGAIKKLWGCTKLNLGSYGDTNPHLHFHIVPKYEGGFEFGGSFAIGNDNPVFLKDEEYQEMIAVLKAELGI
ncbi:MAG: HIT family protein [Intestinibacillus sp.]